MFYCLFLIFCAFLPFQFALNPTDGIDLAIVRVIIPLLFLIWIILALKNKKTLLLGDRVTFFILLFLALAFFSLFFAHNLAWSMRKLLFLFSLFPVYFITSSVINTKQKQRKVTIALVSGASIIAFFGIIQFAAQFVFGIDTVYSFLAHSITPFFLGNSFAQTVAAYPSWLVSSNGVTYMRTIANFPDPHMFSYYLGMLAPWSIALWVTSSEHKKMFLLCSLLIITADILTFTRGGYVALMAGMLIILPLVGKSTVKKLITGITLLIILIALVPHNPVSGRFLSSFDVQEGSNQARIGNWQQALSIITAHPLGVGIGQYSLEIDPKATYREPIYAHNLYLDIAAELGVISLLVFLAFLFFVFLNFWKIAKLQPFFIAGVASISIFAVHSLVESPLYSVHILPLLLITAALSVVAKKYV